MASTFGLLQVPDVLPVYSRKPRLDAPLRTMQRWLHHADYLKLDQFFSVLSPGKDVFFQARFG